MSGCAPKAAAGAHGEKIHIAIDPVTRIEGHLKAEVTVENGKVVDAKVTGGMFRGFENILTGRDPRDAAQITQRICGVCPTAHSTASCRALDDAFKVKLTTNGRITRNLILGANYLQSHILHFYHLAALDYVDAAAVVGKVAPFAPKYDKPDLRLPPAINKAAVGQYVDALEMRRICHEMVALFGGKMPHVSGQVVGGTTEIPTKEKIEAYKTRFLQVKKFIEETYVPTVYLVGSVYKDLLTQGVGYKNCIAFGVFPQDDDNKTYLLKPGVYIEGKDMPMDAAKIKEYVKYSWYDDSCTGLHPSKGKTKTDVSKPGAYSFVKSPRYMDKPVEAGPAARMWIENPELSPVGKKQLKDLFGLTAVKFRDLKDLAFSIMGRHVARAEEAYMVAQAIDKWLTKVTPGAETFVPCEIPMEAEGLGLTEAARGALLHYIQIKDKKVANYQIVAATIWNCNPRDDMGQRGPVEQALIGVLVPDVNNPVNVARTIRAFDP